MLDVSGYGLLKDNWFNQFIDFGENKFRVLDDAEKNYQENINMLLSQNIKSKYIESSFNDTPIIESKSISLFIDSLNILNHSNREIKEKLLDLYNYYHYRELNTYPIRNYDLLDQNGNMPINFLDKDYDEIFYDKLIINGGNNKMDVFKTIGQLYNISIGSIPVLTKVHHLNINNVNIEYKLDTEVLNPLLKVICIKVIEDKNNRDNGYDKNVLIMFKIKPHYRTIHTTYMNNQDVYIPESIMWFVLSSEINYMFENTRPINEINNNGLGIVKDLDSYLFSIYNCYSDKEFFKSNRNIDRTFLMSSLFNLIQHGEIRKIIPWPFGNVHDDFRICMKTTTNTINEYYTIPFKNNISNIQLHNIINNFYDDFMESNFNVDLKKKDFILKKNYEEYLDFKDLYIDKENGFEDFINTLEEYRKELISIK